MKVEYGKIEVFFGETACFSLQLLVVQLFVCLQQGELVETAPNVFALTLFHECVFRPVDMPTKVKIVEPTVLGLDFGGFDRQQFNPAGAQRLAFVGEGTRRTVRPGLALQRTKIQQGGVETVRPATVYLLKQ